MKKILVLSGSTRVGSFNQMLAQEVVRLAQEKGVAAEYINLKDYPLPLYDGDDEAQGGVPENGQTLAKMVSESAGVIFTSPEYNGFFSPLLKNTIDWMSRTDEPLFAGKPVGLLAASPGALGGLRGLPYLRLLLAGIGALVVPQQFALGGAGSAFDAEGRLHEEAHINAVQSVIDGVVAQVK